MQRNLVMNTMNSASEFNHTFD